MINLFAVYSQIEDDSSAIKRISPTVDQFIGFNKTINFQGYFGDEQKLNTVFNSDKELKNPTVIINSSGGTETLINIITSECESPVLILADSKRNSFASSLEAFAYLKEKYSVKTVFCDTVEEMLAETAIFIKAVTAINEINKINFGLIGEPSDWLLTSREIDRFGHFKTSLIKIDIGELVQLVEQVPKETSNEIMHEWQEMYSEISVDEKSLEDSARVYIALRALSEKYKLHAMTVRCFDLLQHNYTACMGISKFNDEGLTSGCEGDLPATFTMMIAQQLTGRSVWMANPSSIKKEKDQIIFAHCTVPSTFLADTSNSGLTTHMESGLSTAVRGPLKNSVVTVMRINSKFDKITAASGKIVESDMQLENVCRTQAVVQLDSTVEKWINTVPGNHQIIVYGDITNELKYFCDFSKIEMIELN